ncbi:MAG: DUF86 domain-containing protein [Actinomycetota bacterium]|nr:DUF86 domain-containing protein [Actinomycetota bacterium]
MRQLIVRLEDVREQGESAYLADEQLRLMTERCLQLAAQICVDLGLQVLAEQPAPTPEKYADVFRTLGREGLIESDLADRLANAAKQRNLLVHLYLEVDDKKVFASLTHLDDLRQFAAFVGEQLD